MFRVIARLSLRATMVLIIGVFAAGFSTAMAQTATEVPTVEATEVATTVPTEAATEVATEAVADLPDTGQGSTASDNSMTILLLLTTSVLVLGGGFLILRNKRV